MLEPNSVYKVKFEVAPGEFDFGRATIVAKSGSQLYLHIKTSQSANKSLPSGTKIWFVQDTSTTGFAGLWAASVSSSQMVKGQKVLVCSLPKLKPLKQRRKVNRVEVKLPVTITTDDTNARPAHFYTLDLCRSGSKIETKLVNKLGLETGMQVKGEFQLPDGVLKIKAQIIRVESNWLANKSLIALQFIALSKESSERLDKFLIKLGGTTRSAKEKANKSEGTSKGGLDSWSTQLKEKRTTENMARPKKTTTLADMAKPLVKAQSVKAPAPPAPKAPSAPVKKPAVKKRTK